MNDLHTLSDAFAELERRADTALLEHADEPAIRTRRRVRAPLVAASVVAVVGLAAGVAVVAHSGGSPADRAGHGGSPSPSPTVSSGPRSTTASEPSTERIPSTPAELARRFRAVLHGSATFVVTDAGAAVNQSVPVRTSVNGPATPTVSPAAGQTNGAAIAGRITAGGVTGGFDLQIYQDVPGDDASCDDPDRAHCSVRRLADGTSLATGRESLPTVRHGVTYEVFLIRADGYAMLMHVSDAADPKGDSAVLAARPPLSTQQMTEILMSGGW